MSLIQRVLRLGAPVALALVIGAPAALAISPISEQKCQDPAAAASDLATAVENSNDFVTCGLDEKDCSKLCKELEKTCNKNAKNREKCVKEDDKFYFKAQDGLCKAFVEDKDQQKECRDFFKQVSKDCKDALKELKDDAKTNCAESFDKDSECVDACQIGAFPFDCIM